MSNLLGLGEIERNAGVATRKALESLLSEIKELKGQLSTLRQNNTTVLSEVASVIVRDDGGSDVGPYPRINLIPGSLITVDVAADPTDNEIDVTIGTTGIIGTYLPLAGGTETGKVIFNMTGVGASDGDAAHPTKYFGTEAVLFDQEAAGNGNRYCSDFMRFHCTGYSGSALHRDVRMFMDTGVNNNLTLAGLKFQASADTTNGIDGTWADRFMIYSDGGAVIVGTVIQLGSPATGSYAAVTNDPTGAAFAVYAHSTQTGNIQEWWDKNGNLVCSIDFEGKFSIFGYAGGTTNPLLVYSPNGAPAIIVDSSQTTIASASNDVNIIASVNANIVAGATVGAIVLTAKYINLYGEITLGSASTFDAGANPLTNLADPSSAQDAATKAYVDAAAASAYTDEKAQDAVGGILVDSATIDFTYADATPSITASVIDASISLAKMANVATATVFYRKTASTGVPEVQTLATLKTDLGLTGTNSGDQDLSGYLPLAGAALAGSMTLDFTGNASSFAILDHLGGPLFRAVADGTSGPEIGLYNAASVPQYAASVASGGFTFNAGTLMDDKGTSDGGLGGTAYTFIDVVAALKLIGILGP